MRVLSAYIVVFGLVASPAMARAAGARGGDNPATANATDVRAAASNDDPPAKPSQPSMESELQQLRDLLESQAKQLQEQGEQLKQQREKMEALEERLVTSGPRENLAAAPASTARPVSVPPTGVLANALSTSTASKAPNQDKPADQPIALRYKGITLTPGGYMAAETVWRNRAIGSGVNSSFNAVPLPGSQQSHISEFNAEGRQSRISMLAEGKLSTVKIGGYYEGDFLSAGTTSNDNQSNSYTFRQRQFWGQAKFDSGWTVTGGQMWSLVTETKTGVDNRTEATTQTIDAQYNVGFSWARQYGLRLAKDFGNKVWLGAAVEEAQTTLTAHGQNNDFLVGSFGISGGLYNPIANYAFAAAPDLVFKAAFQPGWGHYEIFGVLSRFRDRVFPCQGTAALATCAGVTGPSAAGAFNDTRTGGGVGANARARFFQHLDVGVHFFGGDGIGRYGSVGLAQTTVRPDGTLAPIRNYQSLGTIELFTKKLDVYANVGNEYNARAGYVIGSGPTAKGEGYGSPRFANSGCWTEPVPGSPTSTANGVGGAAGFVPGSLANCTGDTRSETEGTLGFWYRFYRGPAGTVQWGVQESYFVRDTWSGVGTKAGVGSSGQPHGTDNMVFTSFRYYLP
jgi:hypothetical protein